MRKNDRPRRGAAAVETALTAPLLFLMFFAGIEFSRANMVRNVAENAAFEGARSGILPGATAQQCIDRANAELARLNINGAQVDVTPSVITHTTPDVTVVVNIPLAQNSLPLSKFVIGKTLVQSIKLSRELD
jgi:Flp pilus assembly protein TadG